MSEWKKYMQELVDLSRNIEKMPHLTATKDPYVYIFPDEKYDGVYHLYFDAHADSGSPWMHLLVGSERALLIDTGYGIGDLKGLVEQLTNKPYDVVNTHFHGDHSGGDGQFEKVYVHKFDREATINSIPIEHRFFPQEKFYRDEDIQTGTDTEVIGVDAGFTFDLGDGEKVEMIHMPGHAAGGCVLLDSKTHQLYTGDAFLATPALILDWGLNGPYPEYTKVSALRDALVKFLPRMGEVESLYTGHGKQDLDPGYITDTLDCCNAIIAEPDVYEEYDFVNDPRQKRIKCVGRAMIIFSPESV